MSFPCSTCSKIFSTQKKQLDHIQVCQIDVDEDLAMESQSEYEVSEDDLPANSKSIPPKKSLKRPREEAEDPSKLKKNKTAQRRGVSPTNVTMEEVEDVDGGMPPVSKVPTPAAEAEEYTAYPNDLLTSKWLTDHVLAINTRLHLFSCTKCQQLYTSKNVASHVRTHRKGLKMPFNVKLAQVIEAHHIVNTYPTFPEEVIPELGGVKMVKEFGCPVCYKAGTEGSVQQHIHNRHPGNKMLPESDVHTQAMNNGACKTKYRVHPFDQGPVEDEDEDDLAAHWKEKFRNDYKKVFSTTRAPSNARYVSPWLLRTGWIALTEGKEIEPLREVASMPSKDGDFKWIEPLVHKYMGDASNLIKTTSVQTLQRLNSSEPENQLNHVPFHLHHQHVETIKKYALPIIRLVAALVRGPLDDFELASTPELNEAIDELKADQNCEALHEIFKCLWLSEWPSSVKQAFPDPTVCFLGLTTLKDTGEWAHPREVTGTIAKLSRAIQLTVLTELHQRIEAKPDVHEMNEMKELQHWVKSHEMTTFADLVSLQKYATTIVLSTIGFPKVIFPNRRRLDYNEMLYDGNPVSISGLQQIFTKLEDTATKLYEKDILLGKKLRVDYDVISDNLSSSTPGECFLDNPNNKFKQHMDALGNAIFDDPALFKEFMVQDPSGEWVINKHRAMEFLENLGDLELQALVGTEMTSGAPIRLTELVCSLMRNRHTRTRNVMAVGRYLALIGQYSKTSSHDQMDKMVPRGFSGFWQDMIIQIHTFARPIAIFLAKQIWPDKPEIAMNYSELLFMGVGKEFEADIVSRLMGKMSSTVLGWAMTIRPYRHINIAFKGHKCKGLIDGHLEKEIMSEIHALQSGHSAATERRVYGLDRESLGGISEDMITVYLDASTEYQKAFGIPPGGQGQPYNKARVADYVLEQEPATVVTAAGTTDLTPVLTMLATMQKSQELLLEKITHLEAEVSELKDMRMPMQSTIPTPVPDTPFTPTFDSPTSDLSHLPDYFDQQPPPQFEEVDADDDMYMPEEDENMSLDQPYNSIDMLEKLQGLIGEGATWKSKEQRKAVKHLLRLWQDVIVALPTGVGKSVIALLPTFVENAVTVIVIPLVALMEDWKRRLNAFQIPYEHFQGAKNPSLTSNAKVILVSSDIARHNHWRQAIVTFATTRPIARIVFDEAHYYFTEYDFRRQAMQNPYELRVPFPCQVVLLSATLPPDARAWLVEQFAMSNPKTICAPSARPELRYIMRKLTNNVKSIEEDVRKVLKECKEKLGWTSQDRYMIFATFFDKGLALAKALDLPYYHASKKQDILTDEERRSVMRSWLDGDKEGIVCTNALSAGNDYANVRLTIHVGTPAETIGFNQQSGRAGRDGKEAWCVVIPHGRACGGTCAVTGRFVGAEVMTKMCNMATKWPESCPRHCSSKVIDGEGKPCLELPDEYLYILPE